MQIRKPTTTCHVCFEGVKEPTIGGLETVEFPENDDTELRQAELRHQQVRPDCVNKATPFVSAKYKAQKKRDYDREASASNSNSHALGCRGELATKILIHLTWLIIRKFTKQKHG
jgi:hypothetical protein